jgi:hypothetical protein
MPRQCSSCNRKEFSSRHQGNSFIYQIRWNTIQGEANTKEVLVTSRNEPRIQKVFKDIPSVGITFKDVEGDLGSWITAEVRSRISERDLTFDHLSQEQKIKLEHKIEAALIENAQGT